MNDYQWEPASGHPGGWRVLARTPGRGVSSIHELEKKDRSPVLFRSYEAAKKRADQLNAEATKPTGST